MDEEETNEFFRRGHDLRLELIEPSEPPARYRISDLARLRPANNSWTMYQVGWTLASIASDNPPNILTFEGGSDCETKSEL